jgi:putative PIN family toxin of toxin-antitoxin system
VARAVLDTNIVVSGILSATGASRALLELARRGQVELVTSLTLLEELEDVLGRFMPRAAATEIRTAVQELSYLVEPTRVPIVTRDPDDDHVLAAAVTGQASYVVTRDRDLLDLGRHQGIEILQPAPALALLREGSAGN